MKKNYIKPEIEIVAYETESLMVILSAGDSLDDTTSSEEEPGGEIEADAPERRGEWGNLWVDPVEEVMPLKRW